MLSEELQLKLPAMSMIRLQSSLYSGVGGNREFLATRSENIRSNRRLLQSTIAGGRNTEDVSELSEIVTCDVAVDAATQLGVELTSTTAIKRAGEEAIRIARLISMRSRDGLQQAVVERVKADSFFGPGFFSSDFGRRLTASWKKWERALSAVFIQVDEDLSNEQEPVFYEVNAGDELQEPAPASDSSGSSTLSTVGLVLVIVAASLVALLVLFGIYRARNKRNNAAARLRTSREKRMRRQLDNSDETSYNAVSSVVRRAQSLDAKAIRRMDSSSSRQELSRSASRKELSRTASSRFAQQWNTVHSQVLMNTNPIHGPLQRQPIKAKADDKSRLRRSAQSMSTGRLKRSPSRKEVESNANKSFTSRPLPRVASRYKGPPIISPESVRRTASGRFEQTNPASVHREGRPDSHYLLVQREDTLRNRTPSFRRHVTNPALVTPQRVRSARTPPLQHSRESPVRHEMATATPCSRGRPVSPTSLRRQQSGSPVRSLSRGPSFRHEPRSHSLRKIQSTSPEQLARPSSRRKMRPTQARR